jgi:hypothetical protein
MRQQKETANRSRFGVWALGAVTLVALLGATGCDGSVDVSGPQFTLPTATEPPVASGPTVTQSRSIAGVDGVTLRGVGYAEIDVAGMESLTITAPESVMPLLTSEVVGGQLMLDRESSSYQGQASDIRYDIALRRLDELALEGVGSISARGIETPLFTARVEGVGDIKASGRADRQDVDVRGVGSYVAPMLRTRVTHIEVTAGRAEVWATERLEGFVGFGAILEYRGNPTIDIQGGGAVRQIGTTP